MATIEKLKEDLLILKSDLSAYTKELASNAVQSSTDLKEKLECKIKNTKEIIQDLEEEVREKARVLAAKADDKIHDKPYHAAGIAALLGLAIGVLIGRNK